MKVADCCHRVHDTMVYCEEFADIKKRYEVLPVDPKVSGVRLNIGGVNVTFNKCPKCLAWIGAGS